MAEDKIVPILVHEKYALPRSLSLDDVDGNKQGETLFTRLVSTSMIGTKIVDEAVIMDMDGTDYAHSDGLKVTKEQILKLSASIHEPGSMVAGVELGSFKFIYSYANPGIIHGKNKGDTQFCMIAASRKIMVAGIYSDIKQDEAEGMIKDFQKYFRDQGM